MFDANSMLFSDQIASLLRVGKELDSASECSPLVFGNDVDSVDVAARTAMVISNLMDFLSLHFIAILGSIPQLQQPTRKFHRAHSDPASVSQTSGSLPAQLLPPLPATALRLHQQTVPDPGRGVLWRVAVGPLQPCLPEDSYWPCRPHCDRRQV